ncbi:unnamed protein product [Rotaria sp. Silwood2]|nr:unnamed protein product [Rotaria sp. Silwood2]CAF4067145.1 unnamed protein product [Rotaria sp. Silwood2]
MSSARVAHQRTPLQPTLSLPQTVSRIPSNHRSVAAPRFLPILQAPQFPKTADLINENKKKPKQKKTNDHSSTLDNDQNKKVPEQVLVRAPKVNLRQSYSNQPLARRSSRPIRNFEPQYLYI